MVTDLHMNAGREDACRRAPPCAWTSASTDRSTIVVPEAQPSQSQSGLVRATTTMHVTHKNGNYSDESLQKAMNEVTDVGMSLREADKLFGVSTTSLRDYLYGKTRGRHRGIKPTLKSHEEKN